jgi:hypothetical protein
MIEFIITTAFIIVGLNFANDVGTKVYDYAEPKVNQGVEYIEEKLN